MEPLSVTIRTASQIMGLGLTKTWELASTGQIETFKVGRRTLVKFDSLRRLVDAGGEL